MNRRNFFTTLAGVAFLPFALNSADGKNITQNLPEPTPPKTKEPPRYIIQTHLVSVPALPLPDDFHLKFQIAPPEANIK